jgi:serine/threonine protein phosphatase 1
MPTIAIGDVHGNQAALDDLLGQLHSELTPDDTVVFLGDYIDRGPDSKGCIDRVLGFQAETCAEVVALIGNHEDWLMRSLADPCRHSWLLGMEALDTIASYSQDAAGRIRRAAEAAGPRLITDQVTLPYDEFLRVLPAAHLTFLRGLRLFHRTADAVCVHGGLDPTIPAVEAQTRDAILWGTGTFLTAYDGPDLVLYGHWDNATIDAVGWPHPAIGPWSIGIDTVSHGILTAVRLPDRRVFQSGRFA